VERDNEIWLTGKTFQIILVFQDRRKTILYLLNLQQPKLLTLLRMHLFLRDPPVHTTTIIIGMIIGIIIGTIQIKIKHKINVHLMASLVQDHSTKIVMIIVMVTE